MLVFRNECDVGGRVCLVEIESDVEGVGNDSIGGGILDDRERVKRRFGPIDGVDFVGGWLGADRDAMRLDVAAFDPDGEVGYAFHVQRHSDHDCGMNNGK